MELSNWAPEHSEALRKFLAKGLTFSEAAQAINSRFNTSYSRSAALGRARRLRLAPDDRREPSMPTRPAHLHDIGEPRAGDSRASALPWPVPLFKETKPLKLRCVTIEPRHVSLIELEHGDCRYPYGGDDEDEVITFCGHSRRPGSSYCTPHFHLSRNPIVPSARAVSTSAADVGDRMNNAAHRIAHLRALIGLQPEGCGRRHELTELLRDEISSGSTE
ncbi:GcrA family cell cycle regulator [Bradyrhizobium australiense]|uniref:GcrA cell cycle regulator n=1 Tax=Bradyrhizobium australiense TaxID=2721161 RepID=A0A7Y4GY20_9BRAD|nr:GcrA family cell cycle regulator [Bradyrhizobium australiense]NOJ43744.1 hypothetical protein [Bradyrhizobium australiense]